MDFYTMLDAYEILRENHNVDEMSVEELSDMFILHFDMQSTNDIVKEFIEKYNRLFSVESYDNVMIYQKMLFL